MQVHGLGTALAAAVTLALVSTVGDYLWATVVPGHEVIYGLAHGAVLLACVGLWLGVSARRPVGGAVGGLAIGLVSAGGFYVLAPLLGYAAMFPMWIAMWILFAYLHAWLAGRRDRREWPSRGLIAGVSSGLAFYLISDIWLAPEPGGPYYGWHLVAWTLAYVPGFAALLVRRAGP
jgi:hypothetical protein